MKVHNQEIELTKLNAENYELKNTLSNQIAMSEKLLLIAQQKYGSDVNNLDFF